MPRTPPTVSDNNFICDDNTYKNCTLFVPFGSKSKYESADIWKNFYNIVEYDFAGVEDVIIDEAIVSVENGRIVVEGAETVNVYSIDGKLLYNGNSQSIPTLGSSTYIVLVNGKIYKIAL